MSIVRTFDEQFIYDCAQPIWDDIADDHSVPAYLYFPNMCADNYWLQASSPERGVLGVFLYHPHNSICYEAHTMLLPIARGHAMQVAKESVQWMFQHTPCQRIITNVPSYNLHALALARRAGLQEYGINHKSFLKDGVLYDQHVLGISKGE